MSCFVSEFRSILSSEVSPSSSYTSSTEDIPHGDKKRALLQQHKNPTASHLKLTPPPDGESKKMFSGDANDIWTNQDSKAKKGSTLDPGSPLSDNGIKQLSVVFSMGDYIIV